MTRNQTTDTPRGVRFKITESELSHPIKAAADFLNSSDVDLVCLQQRVRDLWRESRQLCVAAAAAPQNASRDNSAYGST